MLPRARLVELDDAGHATYVDAPEAFARTVADFARSPSAFI
jgi:pimeloyl-ACP methyl ester carboxylesterase